MPAEVNLIPCPAFRPPSPPFVRETVKHRVAPRRLSACLLSQLPRTPHPTSPIPPLFSERDAFAFNSLFPTNGKRFDEANEWMDECKLARGEKSFLFRMCRCMLSAFG